jgi:two-component system sensor histidine kinase VicK
MHIISSKTSDYSLEDSVPSSPLAYTAANDNHNKNENEMTDVVYGIDNVISTKLQFFSNSNIKIDACMNHTLPRLAIALDPIRNAFINAKNRCVKLRCLTEITSENITYCKELMSIVDELRHLEGIKANFMLSESAYLAPIVSFEKGKVAARIIHSNVKELVEQHEYMFDTLWNKAISAEQRIKEIEDKVEVEFIDVIADHEKASSILLDLAKSIKKEALSLMPTARGMLRMYKLGVIDHLIKVSQNGATVKIICPITDENADIVEKISKQAPDIRIMNMYADAPSGILIADGDRFLQAEVKNPMAKQFTEAIGFAIYSNSKHNVNSFKSFFELLWNEHILNEELRRIDKVQKEFINTAAHELRTPIMPILEEAEYIEHQFNDRKKKVVVENEQIALIIRNAKRLERLASDILDVSKIESQSLKLNKERFNLNDVLYDTIQDIQNRLANDNGLDSSAKLYYKPKDIIVEADKGRLTQVVSNILNNAIKFTQEGTITISIGLERKKEEHNNQEIVVSIQDTGQGIDSEILPKLFTKFATKSETRGTGLGLFISKSIVEAHGGKIWAQNNPDGKGATFSFSLPIVNK